MRFAFPRLPRARTLVLGCLCIALVVIGGMIQAAHFHTSPDHDCSLCLMVHSAAQGAAPLAMVFSSRQLEPLYAARPIARPRAAVHFRLASRPPPRASSLLA